MDKNISVIVTDRSQVGSGVAVHQKVDSQRQLGLKGKCNGTLKKHHNTLVEELELFVLRRFASAG